MYPWTTIYPVFTSTMPRKTINVHMHNYLPCFSPVICNNNNNNNNKYELGSKCNNHRPYIFLSRWRLAYLTPTLIKSKHVLFFSLQFQIPIQISKSFEILLECTIYRACFHFFLCRSKMLQIPSQYTIYHLVFIFSYSSKF